MRDAATGNGCERRATARSSRLDDDWWERRFLAARSARRSARSWCASDDGASRGSPRSALRRTRRPPRYRVRAAVHGVRRDRRGVALDGAVRLLPWIPRRSGKWSEWAGPPTDPVAMLVPPSRTSTPFRYDWMLRLLDVAGARSSGAATRRSTPTSSFAVDEPMFPENGGPWRMRCAAGAATVEPRRHAGRPADAGGRSLLGDVQRVPAHADAVRLGYLGADDPAVGGLHQAAVAAPTPGARSSSRRRATR